MSLRDGLVSGLIGGILWGVLSLVVNGITGIFPYEHPVLYNLVMFVTGGALFGIVTGGLLTALWDVLPFSSVVVRATVVSVFIWMVLRAGGVVLSYMNPYRYHTVFIEAVQGLVLAFLLGIVVGMVIRIRQKHHIAL